MTDSTVTANSTVEGAKRSLSELLKGYFDGDSHVVGQVTATYPAVRLAFDATARNKGGEYPLVEFNFLTARRHGYQEEFKVDPAGEADGPWYEFRTPVVALVTVVQPYNQTDAAKNMRGVDKIWGLLFAIFNCLRSDFASRGIFFAVLDAVPSVQADQDFAIASGFLKFEIRAKFTRQAPLVP